jgi:hypothetical protein
VTSTGAKCRRRSWRKRSNLLASWRLSSTAKP